jgi:hypothetical protein
MAFADPFGELPEPERVRPISAPARGGQLVDDAARLESYVAGVQAGKVVAFASG